MLEARVNWLQVFSLEVDHGYRSQQPSGCEEPALDGALGRAHVSQVEEKAPDKADTAWSPRGYACGRYVHWCAGDHRTGGLRCSELGRRWRARTGGVVGGREPPGTMVWRGVAMSEPS